MVVFTLDHEEGSANFTGERRLHSRELELGCQFLWNVHPHRQFEADSPFAAFGERVQDVDREAAFIKHMGPANSIDQQLRCLEGFGPNDDVPFREYPRDVVDELGRADAGSVANSALYLLEKYRASFARSPASASACGEDSSPAVDTVTKSIGVVII